MCQAIIASIPDHITCTKKYHMQENIEVVVEENSSFSRVGMAASHIKTLVWLNFHN